MSSLKIKRGQIKSRLTRLIKHFEAIDQSNLNDTILEELQCRLERNNSILCEFDEIQLEIETLDESEFDSDEREKFEDSYFKITAAIRTTIKQFSSTSVVAIHSGSNKNRSIQLPTIKLPTFNGAYDHWLEFKDTFNALVHNDNTLGKSEKFYYLKSSLVGDASQLLKSIEVTDDNYSIAWNLLQERYENKKLIIYNHVDAIFELPIISKESHKGLRNLFDNVVKHLRSLASLGQPTQDWDTIIIYIISKKLDPVTRRDWESFDHKNDLPTMDDMSRFLKAKCELLEKLEGNKGENNKVFDPKNYKSRNKVQSNFSSSDIKCYFCQNSHAIYFCEEFLRLSIADRFKRVKILSFALIA